MILDEPTYKQLIILVLQFFGEENFKRSFHSLVRESKVLFDWDYFSETLMNGEWAKAEKYLSAFTRMDDNWNSRKLFLEIRKRKFCEALDGNEYKEAARIYWEDLDAFSSLQDEIRELIELFKSRIKVCLLASENPWENQLGTHSVNPEAERIKLCGAAKMLIAGNPILQDKVVFPNLLKSGLFFIINHIYPKQEPRTIKASFDSKILGGHDDLFSVKMFKLLSLVGHTLCLQEELTYLILQFLEEEKYKETRLELEQEAKIFFNMNQFAVLVLNGEWDSAKKYLSAFTELDDSRHSIKKFFEMQKESMFSSCYTDNESARAMVHDGVKQLVEETPVLQDKVKFPCMIRSRLLTIIKQAMDWWVPYRASTRPNANGYVSLEGIPTVPYLCHAPSFVTEKPSDGAGVLPGTVSDGSNMESILEEVGSIIGTTSSVTTIDWKPSEINEPSECRILVLPIIFLSERVAGMTYSYSGDFLLALTPTAVHKLWTQKRNQFSSAKANSNPPPLNGIVMTKVIGPHSENALPCFALKDSHLFLANGKEFFIFNLKTFEILETYPTLSTTATYLTFLPQDIFAMGFDDSSITIHCLRTKVDKAKLKGHHKRITSLAFSHRLDVLVSLGADAQLCVWSADGWEMRASKLLQNSHTGQVPEPSSANHIEFHTDQIQLLVVHERQIDVFKAPTLDHIIQCIPQEVDLPITYATYSCDGRSVFLGCKSGCIKVLSATTLQTRCQINLTAYAQPRTSLDEYPLIIAAHPSESNQITLGLSSGRVIVLEPLESEGEWGAPPPPSNVHEAMTLT